MATNEVHNGDEERIDKAHAKADQCADQGAQQQQVRLTHVTLVVIHDRGTDDTRERHGRTNRKVDTTRDDDVGLGDGEQDESGEVDEEVLRLTGRKEPTVAEAEVEIEHQEDAEKYEELITEDCTNSTRRHGLRIR